MSKVLIREKAATVAAGASAPQPRLPSTLMSKVFFLSSFLALLLVWHCAAPYAAWDLDLDWEDLISLPGLLRHGKDATSSFEGQCPQVAPLTPKQSSNALDEMDKYLRSDAWRNISIQHLADAVKIPSMSFDDLGPVGKDERWNVFYSLAAFLENTYPLVHQKFTLDKVNTHGLAYTWLGTDITLKPILLMAHQDVVPVNPDTAASWEHPPFSGFYDGKRVWGRGSSDCKNSLTGILDALELLIKAGFEPRRGIILSFGFDEESSGRRGAGHLAPFLLERYGKDSLSIIVDEGAGSGTLWGRTFALPGVAEKGYIDVDIIVKMPGGHSSIPPDHNGIGVMSDLITHIEADKYETKLYDENPYLGLLQCGAAHSDKFPSKLKKLLSKRAKSGNVAHTGKKDDLAIEAAKESLAIKYLMTTSIAADVIRGGVKVNALPERTEVLVNHRVNVGESTSVVKTKLTAIAKHVASRYNLTVHTFDDSSEITESSITLKTTRNVLEPAPVTPTVVDPLTPYTILSGTTRALYGEEFLVAPGIMTGNTDTRYYWDLSRHIFRYGPGYDPDLNEGLSGIHTVNEYVSAKGHLALTQWYSLFIRNMDEADLA